MTVSRYNIFFAAKLVFFLLCVGMVHYQFFVRLNIHLPPKTWAFSYFSNFLLSAFATLTIYILRLSHTAVLGYVFLATSLLKIIIFPLLIQPVLLKMCPNTTHLFFLFFVPYFVFLIIEITVLIKALNRI